MANLVNKILIYPTSAPIISMLLLLYSLHEYYYIHVSHTSYDKFLDRHLYCEDVLSYIDIFFYFFWSNHTSIFCYKENIWVHVSTKNIT